jgi:hypothetical protein
LLQCADANPPAVIAFDAQPSKSLQASNTQPKLSPILRIRRPGDTEPADRSARDPAHADRDLPRIITYFERQLTKTFNDIEHVESQSLRDQDATRSIAASTGGQVLLSRKRKANDRQHEVKLRSQEGSTALPVRTSPREHPHRCGPPHSPWASAHGQMDR